MCFDGLSLPRRCSMSYVSGRRSKFAKPTLSMWGQPQMPQTFAAGLRP